MGTPIVNRPPGQWSQEQGGSWGGPLQRDLQRLDTDFSSGPELTQLNNRMTTLDRHIARGASYPKQHIPAAGGGATITECRIARIVREESDAQNQDEIDYFNEVNQPFAVCFPIEFVPGDPKGMPPTQDMCINLEEEAIFAFLPCKHNPIQYFTISGEQKFNADPTEPTFFVANTQRGNTLIFLPGANLMQEPAEEDLCPPS